MGAAYERLGRSGFAHLFEHLIGQGVLAETDFTAEAERIGASNVSGSIRHDFTEFFATVPAGALERMPWLESERFARLAEQVTQQNFDKQREIVRNERRQKIENRPYGRVNMLLHQNTLPAEHPYGHDAIGTHADLLAATLEDVREFHRTYYTPDSTMLVLAGDFDSNQARLWIAKYCTDRRKPGPSLRTNLPRPRPISIAATLRCLRNLLLWRSWSHGIGRADVL